MYDGVTDSEMHLGDIMIREHHAVPYIGQSKEEIKEMHEMNREYVKVQE